MQNLDYEEYMKNILGYSLDRNNIENTYNNYEMYQNSNNRYDNITDITEFKSMFPDIYQLLNPMISKTCDMYRDKKITENILEEMVTQIYTSIQVETNNSINVTVNSKSQIQNRDEKNNNISKDSRQLGNNFLLKDLIKILILQELINRCHNNSCNSYPVRPHHWTQPPMIRPPYFNMGPY